MLYNYTQSVTSESLMCLAQSHRRLQHLISAVTYFYCASAIKINKKIMVMIMTKLSYSYLIIHFKISEITIMIIRSYFKNLYVVFNRTLSKFTD